jgi:Concanavalin A-like lectin/glucanases superfamily
MNGEHLMNGLELMPAGRRALQAVPAVALTLVLITAVVACGVAPSGFIGGAGTGSGSGPGTGPGTGTGTGGGTAPTGYSGPAATNADVLSFQTNLWANLSGSDRCGGCHKAGGQAPLFARSDDVNLAYQAAGPLVNFTNPALSELVIRVGEGHNCFLASAQDCANSMTTWIKNWIGGTSSAAAGIVLTPPPDQSVGSGKLFPADSSQFQALIWSPILRQFCSDCHRPDAATPQTPYHASSDPAQAYLAAQSKIDLNTPSQSRFVVRLRDQFHHCWAMTAGGAPDCPGSAAAMLAAITSYANQIPVTNVDPALVLSRALSLKQGTPASGASRYEANIIAKYEFKTGTGNTAYDTSAVAPAADLTLTGGIGWVGGWGISIGAGGAAQASTSASHKLAQTIQSTGEYSIEVWATPANVAQTNAYIVTYSGSNTLRNMTLGQHAMQYEARTHSSNTDNNGAPALLTSAAGMFAQASLQHLVLTYDAVNGQQIYVNGKYTGDADPAKGGTLGNWDSTFALVLGNETTGQRQWQGVIKFAAIHGRALTAAQVQQNFAAGVGERYYLLFNVSSLTGVLQSFIMMEGSQYDSYSYLLRKPRFISLDPNAAPANIPISGVRIGVNGTIAKVGQSYATMSATIGSPNYTFAGGQLLSNVGAVIASDRGADSDMFFLSFDKLGSNLHPFVEPTANPPMTADNTPRPDLGIATFEKVNRSLAAITGVPITNSTVAALYNSEQQSLPSAPRIDAFLAAQQTAITQLATAYCGQLLDTQSLRDAFFGTGLDASINATSAAFFGTATPNTTNRGIVINALIANAIGANVDATAASAARNELNALLTRIPTLSSTATVSQATKAACTAVLASAAVTLQ